MMITEVKIVLKVGKKSDAKLLYDEGSKISRFSAESAVRYLDKSAESSDENEMIEFGVAAKGKTQKEYHSSSSLQGRKLPLRTSTRVLGKNCDQQVLYHGVFTMLMRQSFSNIRPNPIPFIEDNCQVTR